jgi:PAS domain S-box-containing protein
VTPPPAEDKKGVTMGTTKDKSKSTAETKLRNQAVEQLRKKKEDLHLPRTEKDAKRLVHELEVHQIELEMQNAELRRAQEELELSRNKYLGLYDFAPVGYFTFDPHGLILEVNLTGAKMLGAERKLLLKKPFINFITQAEGRVIFTKHLKEVFQKQDATTCEILLKRKDGPIFPAQLQSIVRDSADVKAGNIHTSIIDVTEHKKAEAKIEHLASFPELNPNPVIETDLKGKIVYFNTATTKTLKKLNIPEDDIRFLLPRDLPKTIKEMEQRNDGRYELCEVEIAAGRLSKASLSLLI